MYLLNSKSVFRLKSNYFSYADANKAVGLVSARKGNRSALVVSTKALYNKIALVELIALYHQSKTSIQKYAREKKIKVIWVIRDSKLTENTNRFAHALLQPIAYGWTIIRDLHHEFLLGHVHSYNYFTLEETRRYHLWQSQSMYERSWWGSLIWSIIKISSEVLLLIGYEAVVPCGLLFTAIIPVLYFLIYPSKVGIYILLPIIFAKHPFGLELRLI